MANGEWRMGKLHSLFATCYPPSTVMGFTARTICVTINWKEVCKFFSGAFFVSTGVLFYLYLAGSPIPVLGAHLAVTPTVNGVRAAVHAVLFVVFFYLGYIRK
jgi:hypothetical protein